MTFRHSLFERMKAWVELLAKRDDLEFVDCLDTPLSAGQELQLGAARELPPSFPEDARAFATHAERFAFSYRLKAVEDDAAIDDEAEELREACTGFLWLHVDESQDEAYMVIDDEAVDPERMHTLDADAHGTGLAAWYVLGETPLIVWDLESLERFSSLTEYLTTGAKRAFAYNPCWQRTRHLGEEVALAKLSKPRTTPLAELRERLVRRGAEPTMADDLIAWLGADVALLIPVDA